MNSNIKRHSIIVLAAFAALLGACDSNMSPITQDVPELTSRKLPIINGTKVTGNDYLSTVALVLDYWGSYDIFCTGTLISPT